MQPIRSFIISPKLPDNLKPLNQIAYNLFWSWDPDAQDMFRRLDRDLWEETHHNPVKMLGQVRQERLEAMSEDDGYLAHVNRVAETIESYMKETTWYQKTYGLDEKATIAYFSAEFGLTECLPVYSGGLGILAGDHLKSASEMGLPLVGVGLLYQKGYFRQYLNTDGWQGEENPKNDFYTMPITLVTKNDGSPIMIEVEMVGRKVTAQVWRVQVGRIDLYLLDTNIALNTQSDKGITDELYGGDDEMRIQQEIMLGIGGVRALKALGLSPTVFHMNEGHSAFLALERIRQTMEDKKFSFQQAMELTKSGNIFTTHTPVPAGIDQFRPQLMDKYFSSYYPNLNVARNDFLALGRHESSDPNENFSMAVLAIKLASHINGVSKLHGVVSRNMWRDMWKDIPENEIPITSVTNGIHPSTWISKDLAGLYDRYLGPSWRKKPADLTIWKRVEQIPGEELWQTHQRRRERLVSFARIRLRHQLEKQGALPSDLDNADEVLNPETLTIGFARRFATYKRATLLFHDPVRLAQIMRNKEHPIQIIIAGKAHPKDTPGKELIRKIIHLARMEDFRQNIVFLEDYDMIVSRYMVQGVDVWLNTPRRYMEASGTSGMKASVNGVINMSILDGWWDEAYSPRTGWAIGHGEDYEDFEYQDDVESQAIYNLLEKEIIPLFYERGGSGVPRRWVNLMKSSMVSICPVFNTNRMIREYTERFYLPALMQFQKLNEDSQKRAIELSGWKQKMHKGWAKIRYVKVDENGQHIHQVGSEIEVKAKIFLGSLSPDDVNVEIYHGYIDPYNRIVEALIETMSCKESHEDSVYTFEGKITCRTSGLYGYSVRILPRHEYLSSPHETGLILWANS